MKKIIVIGPALSQTGYGEQCRFALRSLLSKPDLFDVYIKPTNWGKSSWLMPNDPDRIWIDEVIYKTSTYLRSGGNFDISLQVTIPNEWERLTPINIGYTAGIETTRIAAAWIEKSKLMDKIITISNHSRDVFLETTYDAIVESTQEKIKIKCDTPIDVVHYPVRNYKPSEIDFKLTTDFNFLTISQWGPRKNLDNTIGWWVEEFKDQEVGLIVKTNLMKNSTIDRIHTQKRLDNLLSHFPNRKCKVYLLHGYMTPQELTALYQHKAVKAFISLTHGEGFGLPLFEAAYNGVPIIAPNWSGHVDFLYAEKKVRRNKKTVKKNVACFSEVKYKLDKVQPEVVWENVIDGESSWCYPQKDSYQKCLKSMVKDHRRHVKTAETLKKHIVSTFPEQEKYDDFCKAVYKPSPEELEWQRKLSEIEIL